MTTLRIEHAITDYDTWRGAFERAAPFREQAGVSNYRVQRPIDDPHYLMIDLDFDDVAGAESLLAILRERIWASPDSSGVISASGGHLRLIEAATGIEPVYRALQALA